MAITIVATVGSASANSFVTEAEQIAYMAARLNASSWTTVTGSTLEETEKAALVEATREISARDFKGQRVDSTQALSFPRDWCPNPDSPVGDYYDTTVIPQRIKDATSELAFQFLKAGTSDIAGEDANQNIISRTVDVLSTEYSDPHSRTKGLARFPRVWQWIKPLLASSGITVPVVRG